MRFFLFAALVMLWPAAATACNACKEDKIAATYDWQVVSAAKEHGHTVVFTAIQGKLAPHDAALAQALRRKLGALHGVDPGTVRVSLAPPAASFAIGTSPASVLSAANRALAPSGLSLTIVRVGAP